MLIFIWLFGDFFKLAYYYDNEIPLQLQLCSGFQVLIDLLILSQFPLYGWDYEPKNNKMEKVRQSDEEINFDEI